MLFCVVERKQRCLHVLPGLFGLFVRPSVAAAALGKVSVDSNLCLFFGGGECRVGGRVFGCYASI